MKLLRPIFTALLLTAALLTTGCEKPAPLPEEQPIVVNYAALDGAWQLTSWQGGLLDENSYLYIEFDRSERRYTMWDNIDSMYATNTTGTFSITQEEDGSYTLSGTYDHGVGDWSYRYEVRILNNGDSMQWRARGGSDVMDFERIDEIPELY